MHDAPEDPDLRLALLLVWALHAEAEHLAGKHDEAMSGVPDPG